MAVFLGLSVFFALIIILIFFTSLIYSTLNKSGHNQYQQGEKRIIIVHGYSGDPNFHWYPWIKEEFNKDGVCVIIPKMPPGEFPRESAWVKVIRETVIRPDNNTYIIGHSLGVAAILRYLETLGPNEQVGGVILIAGFSKSLGRKSKLNDFFKKEFDYKKIKSSSVRQIKLIYSSDDKVVSLSYGILLREHLNAELIILDGRGHFNQESDCMKLPELKDIISKLFK